jgi:AraC-like DNA-binding protein
MPDAPITISTERFPVERREALWRELVTDTRLRVDWTVPDQMPLVASITPLLLAGDIEVAEMAMGPFIATNTLPHAAQKDHRFSLHIMTGGHSVTTERNGREYHMKKTMGVFLDEGKFYRHSTRNVTTRSFIIMLPKARLLEAVPNLPSVMDTQLDLTSEPFRVLQEYVQLCANGMRVSEPLLKRLNGDYVMDLVALTFGGRTDAHEQARLRGLPATRTALILSEIERNLGDPKLSGKTVAARVGITERYLQQLMEEQGETFSHYVLRHRLEKAANLLRANPLLRIAEVAFLCGFNDLSYFNRSFKKRFGENPRAYRK